MNLCKIKTIVGALIIVQTLLKVAHFGVAWAMLHELNTTGFNVNAAIAPMFCYSVVSLVSSVFNCASLIYNWDTRGYWKTALCESGFLLLSSFGVVQSVDEDRTGAQKNRYHYDRVKEFIGILAAIVVVRLLCVPFDYSHNCHLEK